MQDSNLRRQRKRIVTKSWIWHFWLLHVIGLSLICLKAIKYIQIKIPSFNIIPLSPRPRLDVPPSAAMPTWTTTMSTRTSFSSAAGSWVTSGGATKKKDAYPVQETFALLTFLRNYFKEPERISPKYSQHLTKTKFIIVHIH